MSDPTQKYHLYHAHPPSKADTLKLDFSFSPELSSITSSYFFLIPLAERKMKAPNPVTAGRQDPCLFQDLPPATWQVKEVSCTRPLQHFCLLSVLTASRSFFLPHSPSSVQKISFHLFFVFSKETETKFTTV